MGVLQALVALISKSAGRILNAIFGWAVNALFGRSSAKERTFLSALVAAAAVWPLLLVGMIVPRLATLLLALVPLPHWIPSWAVRLVWIALVVVVPMAIGIAVAAKAPGGLREKPIAKRILWGFPITVGLAATFVLMFFSVPVLRLASIARGRNSAEIPLVTQGEHYHAIASTVVAFLNEHGFSLQPAEPTWWVAAPVRVLRFFAHDAFAAYLPKRQEYYRDPTVELAVYPSGFLVRGKAARLTWARGLIAEITARGEGLQSSSKAAQELELKIRRVWKVLDDEPEAHVHAVRLLQRAAELTSALSSLDVDFDEWQILYRQLLQIDRALQGHRQLLDETNRAASAHSEGRTSADGKRPNDSWSRQRA